MDKNSPKIEEVSDIVRAYTSTAFSAEARKSIAINAIEIIERNATIENIETRRYSIGNAIRRLLEFPGLEDQTITDCTTAVTACLNDEAYITPKYEQKPLRKPALQRVV